MSFRGWPPRVMTAPGSHVVTHVPEMAHGRRCPYCSRVMVGHRGPPGDLATRDHVWPRSTGGKTVLMVCLECNLLKGALSPIEWIQFLISHGRLEDATRALRVYNLMGRVFPATVRMQDVLRLSGDDRADIM